MHSIIKIYSQIFCDVKLTALTQEMHGLPVDPFGAIRLGAPLQNGDQGLERDALHNDVLTA